MATRRRARRKSILGNLTDVERRLRYLEKRPAPSRLSNKVVGVDNIKPFAVATDAIQPQAIVTEKIASLAVETEQIDNQAVTNAKLAENAVQSLQIAPNAVGTSEIANGAVTTDKIEGGAVTNAKLASLSVAEGNLQQNSVSTDKIVNGDVTDIKIDTVSATKVTGQIVDSQIASGVDGSKITNNTISNDKLVNDTITGAKIATGAIGNQELGIDAVLETRIIDGAVTTNKIRASSVTETKMAANSVRGNLHIIAGTVLAAQLGTGSVTNEKIGALSITSGKIADLAVTNAKINNLAVTTGKIADLAVTGEKIGNAEVTFPKIASTAYGQLVNAGLLPQTPLSKTVISGSQPAAGLVRLNIAVGLGANEVAAGNHTHSGGGTVGAHTHPATINLGSIFVTSTGQQINQQTPISVTNHQHPYTRVIGVTVNQNTSTIRFKKEIEDYKVENINKLLNLKLKKFKYKRELKHLHPNREWMYGYMAEDLIENGVEEVIGYDSKGLPESVNYGLLSVFVLELVKKQQNEIDSLKEEIQRLKEKI
jgi:hypothetical protein